MPERSASHGSGSSSGAERGAGADAKPKLRLSAATPLQVTNEAAQVIGSNPGRRYLLIQNHSPYTWRVAFGRMAQAGAGEMLLPGEELLYVGEYTPIDSVSLVGEMGAAPGTPGAGIIMEA